MRDNLGTAQPCCFCTSCPKRWVNPAVLLAQLCWKLFLGCRGCSWGHSLHKEDRLWLLTASRCLSWLLLSIPSTASICGAVRSSSLCKTGVSLGRGQLHVYNISINSRSETPGLGARAMLERQQSSSRGARTSPGRQQAPRRTARPQRGGSHPL